MAVGDVIQRLAVVLSFDGAQFARGSTAAQQNLAKLRDSIVGLGKVWTDTGKRLSVGLTLPIGGAMAGVLKVAGDFEKSMNRVRALTDASGAEFEKLNKIARELGATTQYTAGQAADALSFLAMAGFSANDAAAALPGTLQLAAAAQMELAQAADIVTNVLTGYRLTVDDLGRANDVLAKAFTSANTDLVQLGQAFKYAGPVAAAAGVQFEETAAALAMMGNSGVQADMAGTSLRGAISRVLNPTKSVADAIAALNLEAEEAAELQYAMEGATDDLAAVMAKAGLSFTDAQGRLLPLVDIIRQLEPHANNAGLFMQIFGQRAGPALLGLVSQGSEALAELTQELENAGGTAQRIAEIQMEGFSGAALRFRSAIQELMIALGDTGIKRGVTIIIEGMATFVSWIGRLVQWLNETVPLLTKVGAAFGMAAAALGPLMVIVGVLAATLLPLFLFRLSKIGIAISALLNPIGTAMVFLGRWAAAAGGVRMALIGLRAAMMPLVALMAPWAAAAAAIAAAGYLIYRNWDKIAPMFRDFWNATKAALGPPLRELIATISQMFSELWSGPLGEGIRTVVGGLMDLHRAFQSAVGHAVLAVIKAGLDALVVTFQKLGEAIRMLNAALSGESKAVLNAYIRGLESVNEQKAKTLELTEKLIVATGKEREEILARTRAIRDETRERVHNARKAMLEARVKVEALKQQSAAQMVFGGRNRLLAAERDFYEGQAQTRALEREFARLEEALKTPEPTPSAAGAVRAAGAAEDEKKKAAREPRGWQGPSEADIAERFENELIGYTQRSLSAMQRLARNAEERADLEMRSVEWARRQTLASIEADEDYSRAQKDILAAAVERLAEYEREGIDLQLAMELEREANDLAQIAFDNQREQLALQADVADTQAERKRLALEILRLEQAYRRNQLELVLASETASDAEKARAQAILDSLRAIEAGETRSVERRNETEAEAYMRWLYRSPAEINEAVDRIKINGLEGLNDALVDAAVNFRSLADAAKNAVKQVLGDLLRLQMQKMFIRPLAGMLGLPVPAFANGTRSAPGGLALVGERGPELVNLPRGSEVFTNSELRRMGDARGAAAHVTIAPSRYFDAVVDERIAGQAPAIATAGGDAGMRKMAFAQTRRLG